MQFNIVVQYSDDFINAPYYTPKLYRFQDGL